MSRPFQKMADLDIVFIAPLRAEIALLPIIVHIHKGNVVAHIALVEQLVSIVGIHSLVLGSVKDGCADGHHGADSSNLHRALRALHLFLAAWKSRSRAVRGGL